jgi:XRE family transcriptional regulator, regulator of sulfur utilization
LRREAGLTHEELAERASMPYQRISELERGVANPTFATLLRISEGLGVELSVLAKRIEKLKKKGRR